MIVYLDHRALPQQQPRWELYDNRVQILYIAANVAIAPWPWLRIGGGISFVSSTRGKLDIQGAISFTNPNTSNLQHTVDADLTAVRYPQVGIQVDPRPWLTFSAVYRGQFQLALDIDAIVAGQIVLGSIANPRALRIPGAYTLSSQSVAVFLPQQAVFGVSVRPMEGLRINADLTWVNWSSYVNPTARLTVGLEINAPPGVNVPISAPPPPAPYRDALFVDTLVPRFGIEYERLIGLHSVAVRGGYRFDASPVPDQLGPTNFLDSNRHGLSFGVGTTIRGLAPVLAGGLILDAHLDLQILQRRSVRKIDPADPVGDYVLGGYVLSLGTTLGVLF